MARKIIILLISLLFVSLTNGAEIVRYIDTAAEAGGNGTTPALSGANCAYRSLKIWEDAEDNTGDLVTAGNTHTVHCRASGGAADTTTTAINGWTTGAANYITIIGDDFPANGVLDETKYRLATATEHNLYIYENYVRLVNIQLILTVAATDDRYAVYILNVDAGGSDIRMDSCIIKGVCSGTGSGAGINIEDADATVTISNCVIYGFISGADTSFAGIWNVATSGNNFYNCTIFGNYYGITQEGSGTMNAYNCAVFNNTDDFYGLTVVDYCASDDGDGTHKQDFTAEATDWNKVFTDYTTGDVSLKDYTTTPCCVGVGTDNPGAGLYSDDIIGITRSSIWDIGAFEYVSAGPTMPVFINYYKQRRQ